MPDVAGSDIFLKIIGIGSNLRTRRRRPKGIGAHHRSSETDDGHNRGRVRKNKKGENRHIHGHLCAKHNTFNKHTNLYTHICTHALILTSSFYCLHNHARTLFTTMRPRSHIQNMKPQHSKTCTHTHSKIHNTQNENTDY